ncbi:MAG: SPOR domain-containing protein [Alphaproteobacteria bacterium]|nr:MAG: SPOR domain-containing protein [Alphaproteobacteria bacterium]
MAGIPVGRLALIVGAFATLSGCADGVDLPFLGGKDGGAEASRRDSSTGSVTLVERDVEAPEVFQVTEEGLWDGRPSLGGVWVAHPDVKEPERVIIRNEANGQFVIGALFRRERETPGPALQVSSDAAAALGMLAGAPTTLNVTALRRQEVPIAQESGAPAAGADGAAIETAALDDRSAAEGGAATDAGAAAVVSASLDSADAPPQRQAPASRPASGLEKPYIQLGLFSVEENARKLADTLRAQGIIPLLRQGSMKGKSYWRVLVGPAASRSERAALLKKVKEMGFGDAYFVNS